MVNKWIIDGGELPHILIRASGFDEALHAARRINPAYCSGHVMNDPPLPYWDEYAKEVTQ